MIASILQLLGLIRRSLRELWLASLVLATLLGGISMLLGYALPRIQQRFMSRGFVPPAVRDFRNALFGFDTSMSGVAEIAYSLAWSHPMVIALLATHAILACTRVLAGEVERGTADVLLALPVSRTRLLLAETLAWLLSASILFAGLALGTWAGSLFLEPSLRPDWSRLLRVLPNLALVYAVFGTIALLAAMLSPRRVWAVLIAVIAAVVSVLINFLYLLDSSLAFTKSIAFLSVLDYYRPIRVLSTGEMPWRDLGILLGACLALWTLAWAVLARRDVATT